MSIYKDCDIRGIYPEELNERTAFEIGAAVGTLLDGREILVCGDVRVSTDSLKDSLIRGLCQTGAHVLDMGIAPTPAAYFAKSPAGLNVYGLAVVTASHNPAQYNGVKFMFGDMPIGSELIQDIRKCISRGNFNFSEGTCKKVSVREKYEAYLHTLTGKNHLKVTVDCGNGTGSLYAPSLFRNFGYEVDGLYCQPDGNFPNRNPNPAVYAHLSALCARVREAGADFGVAFDGDGDRAVFVDDQGRVVPSEKTFVLLIESIREQEAFSVVYDQKCSNIVRNAICEAGGEPLMERSGHTFIKKKFLEHQSELGGEISGHFFFKELGYDDAIYAALRIGEIIREGGKSFHELVDRIPVPYITPDIRIAMPEDSRDFVLDKIGGIYKDCPVSFLDGVRVTLPEGWILVRKSVTEPALTLRAEAKSQESLQQILRDMNHAVPELQLQI